MANILLALAGIVLIWLGIRGLRFESPRPAPDFGNDCPYQAGLLGKGAAPGKLYRAGGGQERPSAADTRKQTQVVIAHSHKGAV